MAEDRPRPSYLCATSPKVQYADLNESLAAQVVDARKNLLGTFNTVEPLEEDPKINLNSTGDDCIKVFLRVRPFTTEEIVNNEDKNCFQIVGTSIVNTIAPPESNSFKNAQHFNVARESNEFIFTKVFNADVSQRNVFEATSFDLVKQFIAGQNALIFSYGVTNAGKTHTIQGTDADPGIIPRALDNVFSVVKDKLLPEPYFKPQLYHDVVKCESEDRKLLANLKETVFKLADLDDVDIDTNLTKVSSSSECSLASSTHSVNELGEGDAAFASFDTRCSSAPPCDVGYLIYISFAEIYNEHVYDLFEPVPVGKGKRRNILKLSEDRHGNIYVKGLTEIYVTSTDEALKLLAAGQKNLRFASTKLNYNSSRSHCAYNIRLIRIVNNAGTLNVQKTSKLTFCDLAGSERSSKTEHAGERVKESGSINTSLLNLGRCISLLRWNQSHRESQQIIPFRDSKLTRIFQNFLVGRGKACMIINISQCASCFDETLHVLKFSAVVKKIKQSSTVESVINHPSYSLLRPPVVNQRLESSKLGLHKSESEIIRDSVSPICEEEGDEDLSGLDTTLADNQQQIQKYQLVIEDLRSQLLEEKRKYLRAEQKIREEVCQEYAKHMSDMEEKLTDARQEGIENAEDLADERIELYIQTVKKSQHNERRMTIDADAVADNDGDGWVPEITLQAERLKLKEKEDEIVRLKSQLNLLSSKSDNIPTTSTDAAGNDDLLSIKTKECNDLSEMLAEAGETFKTNTAEIARLKRCVTELEARLKNADRTDVPGVSVAPKSDYVARLESRIAELEESAKEIASAHSRENNILQKDLDASRVAVAEMAEKLARVDNESNKAIVVEAPTVPASSSLKTSEAGSVPPDTPTSNPDESMNDGFKCIELESKIFELEKSVESLNACNRLLKESLSEAAEREKTLAAANAEYEKQLQQKTQVALSSGQLRTQLQAAESKIGEFSKQLKDAQSKEIRLKKDCRKFEDESKDKSNAVASLESELSAFRTKFDKAQADVLRLESSLEESRRLQLEVNDFREKYANIQLQLEKSIADNRLEKQRDENLIKENEQKLNALNAELKSMKQLLNDKDNELETLNKTMQSTRSAFSLTEEKLKKFESEQKAEAERHTSMSSNFEALKKSLETMSHSVFDKSNSILKLEGEKKSLQQQVDLLKTQSEQTERNNLESTNKLRQELDSAKTSLVELKRSKIEISDSLQSANDEVDRLKRELQDFENKLEFEKSNNERIIADSLQNEKLIAQFRTLNSDNEETLKNLNAEITNKSSEIVEANKILDETKYKLQKTENDATLLQKETMRIKNELELRLKVEEKLKTDLTTLEGKLQTAHSLLQIEKQRFEKEMELQAKNSAVQQANEKKRIDQYGKELLLANEQIEKLSKEVATKIAFIDGLNKKLAKKEETLKGFETEINKVANDHKDVLAGKERQLEAWKQQKEALIVEVENLKGQNKGITTENDQLKIRLSEKDGEINRLKLIDKLPPLPSANSTTARRRKQASTSVEEEANQVEVTPMISKKISQVSRGRSTVDKGEATQQQPESRRKTSTSEVRKRLNDETDSPSQYSVGDAKPQETKKGRKPRSTSSKSKTKTVAVLTDDNSPLEPVNKKSATETLPPLEIPDEYYSGRPIRKAKATAKNGIFAASMYLRNSPNAESSSATEHDIEPKSATKKRKRALYKSPQNPELTLPSDADVSETKESESRESVAVVLNTKKRK